MHTEIQEPMMYRGTEVKDVAALPCLLPLALAMSCQLKVSVTPEGRYQADASYWYKVGCWSWKKKFGDSRRAKKTLSFPVQPARILFQIKKKKPHGFFELCEEDLLLWGTSSSDCASLRCD